MIGKHTKSILLENQDSFLIAAENVATVLCSHPAEHALLVLSKVGYNKIPVLDSSDRLVGLISLANIVDKMVDLNGFNSKVLDGLNVADVMEDKIPSLKPENDLEDALHLLVGVSFLPVVDENDIFKGIVTRKEVLKSVNHLVHEAEKRYEFIPKTDEIKEGINT
ncbi:MULTISPECIES: cyclic-di-AMP-binding protein CbpB [Tetragenococcus]|uniref:CBS domain-containing protein n=3 Tax=Tetragenococcus TaxID=51668 RepID=A0A091C3B4_9ENTE|nr:MULTISPECIES: cyclic-di-AMP-binding protein CbpB [Tetragenococcus]GMA47224.1 CBS domain-containing protein [Tetragenococcus muriaticus]GMA54401.1 CBS domain-containing protein [Alicyclobacillus contaminans]AYW48519.1 CBS domain-containing protein [Tetragenococcus osmophilus]KFN91200.1 CBS domain-containing protein [Tetragenococcus muriaticus 3MR10-3]KFN91647.1 CBS domain-containing protein [Tetragenococcus muriaticus PMC-11-5]